MRPQGPLDGAPLHFGRAAAREPPLVLANLARAAYDSLCHSCQTCATVTTVNSDLLTNPTVRAAIDALQKGDRNGWVELFEPDARLYDDGKPRSLEEFTREALGHERFTSIEHVDRRGLELTGAFHSEKWGEFRTYFRFQLSAAGRIKRLDIGEAGE